MMGRQGSHQQSGYVEAYCLCKMLAWSVSKRGMAQRTAPSVCRRSHAPMTNPNRHACCALPTVHTAALQSEQVCLGALSKHS